jgi:hypothetical protein
MTVWHGTTLESANQIAREGLKPDASRAFDQVKSDGLDYEGIPLRVTEATGKFIFVTADKLQAEWFAQYRTRYEITPVGSFVVPPLLFQDGIKKIGGIYRPDAKPALVQFEIPPTFNGQWSYDPELTTEPVARCACKLPAEYVKGVFPLPVKPEMLEFDPAQIVESSEIRQHLTKGKGN